jgi:hypothetical protein
MGPGGARPAPRVSIAGAAADPLASLFSPLPSALNPNTAAPSSEQQQQQQQRASANLPSSSGPQPRVSMAGSVAAAGAAALGPATPRGAPVPTFGVGPVLVDVPLWHSFSGR